MRRKWCHREVLSLGQLHKMETCDEEVKKTREQGFDYDYSGEGDDKYLASTYCCCR